MPEGMREFDDAKATRRNIYDNVLSAMRKRFPIEDDTHRLELVDVAYEGPQEFSLRQQKNALLRNRNLRTNLVGTWRLTDKRTGKVLDERRDSVMQVPYWTDRGTIINNGSEYTVISQSRLRPGVYARRKSNGEYEAQFNIRPGTGRAFHFGISPETGVMTLQTGQGQIPLYQVLKGLGVDDREIVRYWGADVAKANSEKQDAQAWSKLYSRMAGYKANPQASEDEKRQFVKDALAKYEVDPEVVERTMGLRNVSGVTPELMLRASQKLLNLSRGDERPDNRDNPRFSKFYGVEDYFKERVEKNAGRLANTLLFKARRSGSLKPVRRNALNPWVDTIINGSGLAMPGEEANPLSTLEQMSRISKFGLGGIGSKDAVTMEARDVQGDYLGFVDPTQGPESESIGVDVRAAYNTYLGKDNKLYGEFIDNKTGKKTYVDIATASDRLVAFPGQDMTQPYVMAIKDGIPQKVPRDEVRYTVPSYAHMTASNTNMNPMPTAVQAGRQFYGSKFWSQYLPQKNGEVPLVDSLMADGRTTWSEYYGRKVGTLKSDVDGTVVKVDDNEITIKDGEGRLHKVETVKNLPFNRLSAISYYPSVEVGQRVKAGDMVAHSNFTDRKTGAINMGQNLHVAIMPYRGFSFEDSHLISESAAKRLATDRLYNFDHEARNGVVLDKKKYVSAFPSKFTKEQFETLDDDGIVKPGTVLHRGDPMIVSVGPKLLTSSDKALGKLSKALRHSYTDRSETWEHDYPGTVVDAVRTSSGAKVNVTASPPVRPGDKLSGRFGLKGVVNKIVPDDQMPRDATTNQPYDMLVNPMGFLSRVAPGQMMEISLGKLAKAQGRQVRIPQLPPQEGWFEWTRRQLADNGVSEAADVFDPESGRTIRNIGDGYMYVSAFHHLAEKKASARGSDGAFTQDDQPAKGGYEGAKRMSGLDLWAMLSHNVPEVIKDSHLIRGTRNDDYWRAMQLGLPVPEPDVPFIYKKFLNTLRAGGVNVTEKGSITKIMPQTDKDVDALAQGREITSSDMVDPDFEPMKGGLFDLGKTGGMAGNQWSMIRLPEPVPNPIMEEPVRRVLGLTVDRMEKILSGQEKLDGKTGGQALKDALAKVDVDRRLKECRENITSKKGAARDDAVKQYRYLSAMKKQGLEPQDWMISRVPVIPPAFRPVSKMGDVALVSDLNELYKDVIENAKNFEELRKDVDDDGLVDERLNIYNSVKAAYGLGQPITPENAAKGVKGAIRQVIGSRPKFGQFQSKVISKPVGDVSRGVVTPEPNYDMDQVGLPADMAWSMYKPYVMRQLVQHGYPTTAAIKMIEDRDDTAKSLLEKEMAKRPVIMDRAPTWHKFNLLAFTPNLVEGDSIRVSPLIVSGFNMDFDGDNQIGSVLIRLSRIGFSKILKNFEKNTCKSLKTLLDYVVFHEQRSTAMKTNTKTAIKSNSRTLVIDLAEFPHGELTNVRKDDKYDIEFYSVPDGVEVAAYNEKTGLVEFIPVKYWSIHRGKKVEIVNLHGGQQIVTDDDPRAVYGVSADADSLEPQRFTPTEAFEKSVLVPVVDQPFASSVEGLFYDFDDGEIKTERSARSATVDFDFGQFVGLMSGDGWTDNMGHVYISDNEWFNANFILSFVKNIYPDTYLKSDRFDSSMKGRYGDTIRHRINTGTGIFSKRIKELVDGHRDEHTSGSANKRLPPWYQFAGRDFILGVVNGMVATDGTVNVSNAKDKPQLQISFSSTSIRLVREFKRCCQLLGVRATLLFSKSTTAGNSSWLCSVSALDAKRVGLLDRCCHERKRDMFVGTSVEDGPMFVKNDILPFPMAFAERLVPFVPAAKTFNVMDKVSEKELIRRRRYMALAVAVRRYAKEGFVTRSLVERLAAFGDELYAKNKAAFDNGATVRGRLRASFSKYEGVEGSRRGWKVDASADDADAIAKASQAVRPRFGKDWAKTTRTLQSCLSQIRAKGFVTFSQLGQIDEFFDGRKPNSELRDSPELVELTRLAASSVRWERIDSIEKTGKEEVGYDLTVPGYETFLSDDGIVLSNTVNMHVPSSEKAVRQAMDKMLPSKNLTSLTDLSSPRHMPSKEQIFGLYDLTKPVANKPAKVYDTVADAKRAYAKGEIGPNDPIEIRRK